MSIPRKHHYSPVFYLEQWTGADRQLCEYRRLSVTGQPDRVFARRKFPAGTGYEKNLYRVDGLPEHLAQAVESTFMQMVDTDAKYALNKIVSGDKTPWDPRNALRFYACRGGVRTAGIARRRDRVLGLERGRRDKAQ